VVIGLLLTVKGVLILAMGMLAVVAWAALYVVAGLAWLAGLGSRLRGAKGDPPTPRRHAVGEKGGRTSKLDPPPPSQAVSQPPSDSAPLQDDVAALWAGMHEAGAWRDPLDLRVPPGHFDGDYCGVCAGRCVLPRSPVLRAIHSGIPLSDGVWPPVEVGGSNPVAVGSGQEKKSAGNFVDTGSLGPDEWRSRGGM